MPHGAKYIELYRETIGRKQFAVCLLIADEDSKTEKRLVYAGDFDDHNRRSGFGTAYDPDSGLPVYRGRWLDNVRHGTGIALADNHAWRKSEWIEDREVHRGAEHGFEELAFEEIRDRSSVDESGNIRWPDGSVYEGHTRGGKPDGQGTYRNPNGAFYVGEWKDGMPDGCGTFHYANETVQYRGELARNAYHGRGEYFEPAGGYYVGAFEDMFRHGWGMYVKPIAIRTGSGGVMASVSWYEGEWSRGLPHGQGSLFRMSLPLEAFRKSFPRLARKEESNAYLWYRGMMDQGTPSGQGIVFVNGKARFEGQVQGLTDGSKWYYRFTRERRADSPDQSIACGDGAFLTTEGIPWFTGSMSREKK